MDRKYKEPIPSKVVALIGENFITEHLFNNFKRYSKLKVYKSQSIKNIEKNVHYIIDCSFNERSQNDVLLYSVKNNIKKVIILNHWKKFINEFKDLIIVQAIVPDVYGYDHPSFSRPGAGNNYESPISYCSFIAESIRRMHEAKIGYIPNLYITYGEETIKHLYVENLYNSIQYIIDNINITSEYEIFDEYKNAGIILDKIREVIEYTGNIVFENTESVYNKPVKRLPYKYNYRPISKNIKEIYNHLVYNNEKFMFIGL